MKIPNSVRQIDVHELHKGLLDKSIEIDFAWSSNNKVIFVNFISKDPKMFTKTQFVFKPVEIPDKPVTVPYAYYKGEHDPNPKDRLIPFYQLLSRQFTTNVLGIWSGTMKQDMFNKLYNSYNFTQNLPPRNMSNDMSVEFRPTDELPDEAVFSRETCIKAIDEFMKKPEPVEFSSDISSEKK